MFLRNILSCLRPKNARSSSRDCNSRCRGGVDFSPWSFTIPCGSTIVPSAAGKDRKAGVSHKQRRTIRAIRRVSFRPVLIAVTQLAAPATFEIGRTARERRGPPSPFVSFARARPRRNSVIAFWIGSSESRGFPGPPTYVPRKAHKASTRYARFPCWLLSQLIIVIYSVRSSSLSTLTMRRHASWIYFQFHPCEMRT